MNKQLTDHLTIKFKPMINWKWLDLCGLGSPLINMQIASVTWQVVLCVTFLLWGSVNCGLVAAPLAALVRAPKYDSAIIESDRLGGNFAYSTAESHAYAVVSPVIENVVKPVAVSYTAHPVIAPVAVAHPLISTSLVHAAPVVAPAVVPLPHIVSNVIQTVEATTESTPSPAETPAPEEASDAPAESDDNAKDESN